MSQKLLIVESPAKAKTIEKYLGKDFRVKSSYGHVRDLDKGNDAVNVDKNFEVHYVVTPDKFRVVKELKESVKKADEVWLATDEDREGEAISWHLCQVLGLDPVATKRIVFTEITKPAIQKAVANPRNLDIDLVNAQQARRVLDRLVGYELSEVLWRKIKGQLSAGRVQSVAVRLVVDREREINNFKVESFFKVKAHFFTTDDKDKKSILLAESEDKFESEKEAYAFLEKCKNALYKVQDIRVKPGFRKPSAPFTTSTLQQEASRKLGFSVKRTMTTAQRLYEAGMITYMRTDSVSLSEIALAEIAQAIEQNYGAAYVHTRRYKTKSQSAQEAHEAIRPTYIQNQTIHADRDQERLYELIWKRTIASQMADAKLEKTEVDISISTVPDVLLKANGEAVKFDGFLKVYFEGRDDEDDDTLSVLLPPVLKGQSLGLDQMSATQRFSRPPARYTEASLVKKMEELGIGRPSTYAPTISKIMEDNRGYVTKESREGVERRYAQLTLSAGEIHKSEPVEIAGATRNQLYPSDMGIIVTDFLKEHFVDVMDYKFTSDIEERFDVIAEGKLQWKQMLADFYHPFHASIEKTKDKADRASGERILGTDPASGRTILTRLTRFGKPVVQIGKPEELAEDEKPQYANLKPGQSVETISLEEALQLFTLPREIGEFEGESLIVNTGRFGPYIKFGEQFISLPRGEDPFQITQDRAIEVVLEKLKADAPIANYEGKPVTKGKGRFGPFIKWNDLYINIPKRYDFDHLNANEVHELINAKLEKEATRYIKVFEDNIAIENGRWGPFIRYAKKNFKLGKNSAGEKYTTEELQQLDVSVVKAMIEEQEPGIFSQKGAKKAAKAKTGTDSTTKPKSKSNAKASSSGKTKKK
jgi:DNA topoisomerase-1